MKSETKKKVGKPTFYTKPMKRINVMLDDETIKFYIEHGGGNLSEGIRQYWRGLTKRAPDLWDSAPFQALSTDGANPAPEHLSTPPTSG
jgi:hypothetical protein